jgi:methionyl-tRNA formyltransferase
MDEGLDTGPIILQKEFAITNEDTARTVYDKFTETGTAVFEGFLSLLMNDKEIIAIPQDESQATYYPKDMPGGGKIDWSWDGETIHRFIRAMTFEPFPPPDFMIGEKRMVIIDEKYFPGFNNKIQEDEEPKTNKMGYK